MPISVNPILPVIAAQGAAPDVVLQPGTVSTPRCSSFSPTNLVRIAISSLSIDVLSEVPLQVGQSLQLAVSQTPDGIRLAVVGPGRRAGGHVNRDRHRHAGCACRCRGRSGRGCGGTPESTDAAGAAGGLGGGAECGHAAGEPGTAVCKSRRRRRVECLAAKLQQAVMEVLAQRTTLDQNLTGNDDQTCRSKVRALSRGFAGVGICPASGRRARSQGGIDRASSNAFVLAW
jgi:hypothetical protein